MTVKTFKPRRIVNHFEKEVFTYLSNALEESSEKYLLFGPLRIGRRELDGLVIGQGFMAALEAKAVKGHVSMGINTPVTVRTEEGEVVEFKDRYEDPYDQAEKHWKELGSFIRNIFGETGFWFTSMLVFEEDSTFSVPTQAREALSPDSKIVALEEVPEYLKQLSARYNKTNLATNQEDALIKAITKGEEKLSETEKMVFVRPSPSAQKISPTHSSTPLPQKVKPAPSSKVTSPFDQRVASQPPPKEYTQISDLKHKKPWHRSAWFLWFAFFFLNPVWAFLMLKDRTRNWFVRLVGTLFLLSYLLVCLGVIYLAEMYPEIIGLPVTVTASYQAPSPQRIDHTDDTPFPISTLSTQTEISPNADGICTIIWVETDSESLANKNRAMVWEETIRRSISGSGMTDRQFYDQVLEHNPGLEADGYVFQEGKTYYLPQCE